MEDIKQKLNFIEKAIQSQIQIEANKLIEEAKKELERRTPEIIAGLVVSIMGMAEFKTMEDRIIFNIRKQ